LEGDFAVYNQMYESHVLFQRSFDLERQRYQLALKASLADLLSRLPASVLSMPAEEFLASTGDAPESVGLEEFRLPQGGAMEVMAQIVRLFDAQSDHHLPTQRESNHRPNEVAVEVEEVALRLSNVSP
jgi:hypothetical protein